MNTNADMHFLKDFYKYEDPTGLRGICPGSLIDIVDMLPIGGRIAVILCWHGRHTHTAVRVPATGREFSVAGFQMFSFYPCNCTEEHPDGHFSASVPVFDFLSFLWQVGATEPPAHGDPFLTTKELMAFYDDVRTEMTSRAERPPAQEPPTMNRRPKGPSEADSVNSVLTWSRGQELAAQGIQMPNPPQR